MTNPPTLRSLLCTTALAAVVQIASAAQQGYYRWHDDAGVEHFTQQPPAGRKSEFVATSTGKSMTTEADNTAPADAKGATVAKDVKKPSAGPMEAIPNKDPEKCNQAQETQNVLNSHARIREKVGEEYRFLTPGEVAEQKKLAQESVEVYCEPAPQ